MTSPEPFDLDREPQPPSPPYDYDKAMWFVDNVLSREIPAAIRSHVSRLDELTTLKHGNELRARNDRLAANNNALNARATKAEARVTALEAELKADQRAFRDIVLFTRDRDPFGALDSIAAIAARRHPDYHASTDARASPPETP